MVVVVCLPACLHAYHHFSFLAMNQARDEYIRPSMNLSPILQLQSKHPYPSTHPPTRNSIPSHGLPGLLVPHQLACWMPWIALEVVQHDSSA